MSRLACERVQAERRSRLRLDHPSGRVDLMAYLRRSEPARCRCWRPPTLDEIRGLRTELEQRVVDLQARGEPRTARNPITLEYALGGYERLLIQRHFGRPARSAPEPGERLVRHALELTNELFEVVAVAR